MPLPKLDLYAESTNDVGRSVSIEVALACFFPEKETRRLVARLSESLVVAKRLASTVIPAHAGMTS